MTLLTVRSVLCVLGGAGVAGMPSVLRSQGMDCEQLKPYALVQGVDTAYAPAQALAQELRRHGFAVKCILHSHSESMFDGQAGAAFFQTDRGNFDALFMPRSGTFDRLVVVERPEGDRYVYSFEGEPKPWPANRIDSAKRMYFLKDTHRLLIVWGDDKLAEQLRAALDTGQPR